MEEKDVQPNEKDDKFSKPADPYLMRDFWLQVVQPVERQGRLNNAIKPIKARTKREKKTAIEQNYYLTKHSFGMPDGYDRIDWRKKSA